MTTLGTSLHGSRRCRVHANPNVRLPPKAAVRLTADQDPLSGRQRTGRGDQQAVGWALAHRRKLQPLAGVGQSRSLGRPIDRIQPERDTFGEARERPVGGTCRKPVLHRVEMDIVHVDGVIPVVADRVLPIPALPDAGFALADQGCAPSFRRRDGS
jgi:hypothetical protein